MYRVKRLWERCLKGLFVTRSIIVKSYGICAPHQHVHLFKCHSGIKRVAQTVFTPDDWLKARLIRSLLRLSLVFFLFTVSPPGIIYGQIQSRWEGFSESIKDVPPRSINAWNSTVFIEKKTLLSLSAASLVTPVRGSGLIVQASPDRDYVIVVTNSHVLNKHDGASILKVGFGQKLSSYHLMLFGRDKYNPFRHVWSNTIRILADIPEKDLAFLEVKVPRRAVYSVARFGRIAAEHSAPYHLYSIGYPQLTLRSVWFNGRPSNYRSSIKCFSQGLLLKVFRNYPLKINTEAATTIMDLIFHSVDLLPGNSGGPLFDIHGRIVGLNTCMVRDPTSSNFRYCAGAKKELGVVFKYFGIAIPTHVIQAEFNNLGWKSISFPVR